MMTCFRNLSKLFFNCYQTKTNRKMFQHDFQFFADLMIFFSQKKEEVIKHCFLIFIFHICAKFQTKENLVMTCVFECFQSGGHILKELHDFLCMMGAITIINGQNSFKFNFVDYGLVTISLGARAHLKGWQRKWNVKRWTWIFNNQIRMNHLT